MCVEEDLQDVLIAQYNLSDYLKELDDAQKNFMNGTISPKRINYTNIALVPKFPNSQTLTQFQSISLCNYSYKILSKILANQLKLLLPNLILPMQHAFVVSHQIQDSIIIAHEIFHFF